LGVILANLSLILCRVILEVSSVTTNWVVSTWTDNPTGNLLLDIYDKLGMEAVTGNITDFTTLKTLGGAGIIVLLFASGCALGGCALIAFFFVVVSTPIAFFWALYLIFYIRYFVIVALVIASPLACMCIGFPMTEKYFQQWWGQFVKWAFMPTVSFFIIRIGVVVSGALDTDISGSTGLALMRYMILIGACFYGAKIPLTMGGSVMGSWQKALRWGGGKTADLAYKGYGAAWAKGAKKFSGANDWRAKVPAIFGKIPKIGPRIAGKNLTRGTLGDMFRGTNVYGIKKAWQARQDTSEANRAKAAAKTDLQRMLMGRQARQKADMDDARTRYADIYETDDLFTKANSFTPAQREFLMTAKNYPDIWKDALFKDEGTDDVAEVYFAMKQLRKIAAQGNSTISDDAKNKYNTLVGGTTIPPIPMAGFAAGTGSNTDIGQMANELASVLTAQESSVIKSILGGNANPEEVMAKLEGGADASQIRIDDQALQPEQIAKLNQLAEARANRQSMTTSDITIENADSVAIKGIVGSNIDVNQLLDEVDQGADANSIQQKYGKDVSKNWSTIEQVAARRRGRQDKILSDYADHSFSAEMQLPAEEALTIAAGIKQKQGSINEQSIVALQTELSKHLETLNLDTQPEANRQRFEQVKAQLSQIAPTLSVSTDPETLKRSIGNVIKGMETLKSDQVYKSFDAPNVDRDQIRQMQKKNYQQQFKQEFATNKIGDIAANHVAATGGNLDGLEEKIGAHIDRMIGSVEELGGQMSQLEKASPGASREVIKAVAREVTGGIKVQAGPNTNSADSMRNLFRDKNFRKNLGKQVTSSTEKVISQKMSAIKNINPPASTQATPPATETTNTVTNNTTVIKEEVAPPSVQAPPQTPDTEQPQDTPPAPAPPQDQPNQ
jgi:hypothetical protein